MSVTLDIPPHILERADNIATLEGISLDVLVARALEHFAHAPHPNTSHNTSPTIFGRLRGTVLFMADDFNAPVEDFREYME